MRCESGIHTWINFVGLGYYLEMYSLVTLLPRLTM
jgi:hypothetical protein